MNCPRCHGRGYVLLGPSSREQEKVTKNFKSQRELVRPPVLQNRGRHPCPECGGSGRSECCG